MVVLSALINYLVMNVIVFSFSAIVAFLIYLFSYKTYNLTGEKKFFYFALGFALLALGLILHAIGNLSFYLGIEKCLMMGCNPPQQLLFIAHLAHIILTFFAYNILIMVYFRVREKPLVVLSFIEALILAMLTFDSYLYNVVGFIFLAFIIFGAYKNFIKNKNRNALLALIAFALIALSHILFMLNFMIPAYACLFAGFLSFLFIFKKSR